jgi:outer membrane protein assembly factor BamB
MLNTLSYVTVLNRANGDVYRRPRAIDFGEQGAHKFVANTRGATDGVHYFVGSPDGEYEALRLQEGVLIWTMSTAASLDPINAPLVFANGRLYLTNEDGMVICTSVLGNRGRQEWSQRLAGAVREGIHVDQRGCFVPCRDHRIYAFDPLTGGLLWEPFICRGPLDKAIQVGESSIFQYAEQDAFYVLDVATGRLRWTNKDGRLVLALHGGTVYLKDARNNLLILDEMMGPGKPATRIALVGHELFTGNAAAPAIYTAKADGRVFCITPVGVERLTPEMLQEGKAKTKKPPASGPAPTSAPVLAPG